MQDCGNTQQLVMKLDKKIIEKFENKTNFANQIVPNLYLGDLEFAKNNNDKFDVIFNLSQQDYSVNFKTIKFDYAIYDNINEDLGPVLKEALPIINDNMKQNKKILIHCYAGLSRSASLVIAYLIKYHRTDFHFSYDFINSKRNNYPIKPNIGFIKQLKDFEKQV
jgi:hypothetical protein